MRIYARSIEDDGDEPAIALREVSFVASPDELRAIARFLQNQADSCERWGAAFGHEHFWDWIERLARLKAAFDVVQRAGHEPTRDELVARSGLTPEVVDGLRDTDVWSGVIAARLDEVDRSMSSLSSLITQRADHRRQPDVIVHGAA